MSAKELIEKANRMHSEISEQRKIRGIWRERYHSIAKKMNEASRALYDDNLSDGRVLDEWRKTYEKWLIVQAEDPPPEPDLVEWMNAKFDAVEELAREAGLRMTAD